MKKLVSIMLSLVLMITCLMSVVPAQAAIKDISSGDVCGYQDTDETKFLNGKTKFVYYPEELKKTDKQYPVIVWANGTGCIPADYIGLFRAFAKKGFVVVACSSVMSADGTEQIDCANYIIEKSKDKNSVLYNKIATDKLVAMGHSQGGRSTINAVSTSDLFCCAVSIAGSNYDYEAEKNSTPTLFFTGTLDTVVPAKKWVKPAYQLAKGPAVYASLIKGIHTSCIIAPENYVEPSIAWINAWANDGNPKDVLEKLSDNTVWKDVQSKNLDNNFYASIISNGNPVVIISIVAIMAVAAVVAVIVKKKKQ